MTVAVHELPARSETAMREPRGSSGIPAAAGPSRAEHHWPPTLQGFSRGGGLGRDGPGGGIAGGGTRGGGRRGRRGGPRRRG